MSGDRQRIASRGDVSDLRRQVDRGNEAARRHQQEDVLIDGDRRLKLRSPNGHFWAVTVNNAGALATVDLGTEL